MGKNTKYRYELRIVIAVSYTHLDVYKRQIQKIAESQGEVAPATMMEVFEKEYLRRKAP